MSGLVMVSLKCSSAFFFGNCFWFLVCYATTKLALQLQKERIQVVRSTKVVRRIPTGNGLWVLVMHWIIRPFFCLFLYHHTISPPITS